MTYKKLYEMKFRMGIPTIELEKKFPKDRDKISKLALMELPLSLLRSVLNDERKLMSLLELKASIAAS